MCKGGCFSDIRIRDEDLADGPDGAYIVDSLTTMDYDDGVAVQLIMDNIAQGGDGIAPTDVTSKEFVGDEEDPDPEISAIPDMSAS
jgi:hypothetical protein